MHFADGRQMSLSPWQGPPVLGVNGECHGERLLVELHRTPGVHTLGSLSRGESNQPFSPCRGQTYWPLGITETRQ